MSEAENIRNTGPTTSQTAARAHDEDSIIVEPAADDTRIPEAGRDDSLAGDADMAMGLDTDPPITSGLTADAAAAPSPSADVAPGAQLLDAEERDNIVARWREIQAEFVDEPRTAIREADALVTDLVERLSRAFASELEQLESRWASGAQASTEDLRQGLQRYRSFFERLLAA
ncbi:MAG TPA: hypothetical protein VIV12_02200 [Streptosporangiaceae bacterium]